MLDGEHPYVGVVDQPLAEKFDVLPHVALPLSAEIFMDSPRRDCSSHCAYRTDYPTETVAYNLPSGRGIFIYVISSCEIEYHRIPCGKLAGLKCAHCGLAVCADCRMWCCGKPFCGLCGESQVSHCVKKSVQSERQSKSSRPEKAG